MVATVPLSPPPPPSLCISQYIWPFHQTGVADNGDLAEEPTHCMRASADGQDRSVVGTKQALLPPKQGRQQRSQVQQRQQQQANILRSRMHTREGSGEISKNSLKVWWCDKYIHIGGRKTQPGCSTFLVLFLWTCIGSGLVSVDRENVPMIQP